MNRTYEELRALYLEEIENGKKLKEAHQELVPVGEDEYLPVDAYISHWEEKLYTLENS